MLTVSPGRVLPLSVVSVPVAWVQALRLYHIGQRAGQVLCGRAFPVLHLLLH